MIDMFIPGSEPVPVVQALNVGELPRGKKGRLLLDFVHDGRGWPVRLPILWARGERDGPVFGITAAVHGNELNGIPVIHRLFEKLDPGQLRGTVVAVVAVNLPGLLAHTRDVSEGMDLNRIMPGRPDGNAGEVYAHRFIQLVLRHLDYLVDLHTASFGRVNSLYIRADMTDATATQMALLHRPQIIVHNPPSDGTLRGAAMELGIPAITVEIGNPQQFQAEYVRSSLVGVRSVLSEAGMLPRRQVPPATPPVVCRRSYWMYTDHGGLLDVVPKVTQLVEQGEVVARLSNLFGDVVREYAAPERGVIVGRSVNPVGPTGARIVHLGIVATPKQNLREQLEAENAKSRVEGPEPVEE
jgi:predicted deacylase